MKKLILLFTLLISGITFSQFTITESSTDWKEVGQSISSVQLYSNVEKAKIRYLDATTVGSNSMFSQSSVYEFEFSIEPDTLDKIHKIIKEHFAEKKVEKLTLQFPEGNMYLNFYKFFGQYYFNFEFNNNNGLLDKNTTVVRMTGAFTNKTIDKLFGKTK